jgi:hypothetical protein
MSALEDKTALQKRAWDLANAGNLVDLRALLEENPEMDVDEYKNTRLQRALYQFLQGGPH